MRLLALNNIILSSIQVRSTPPLPSPSGMNFSGLNDIGSDHAAVSRPICRRGSSRWRLRGVDVLALFATVGVGLIRGHPLRRQRRGGAYDGVDAAWAGTKRRRRAVASAGEEDERRGAMRCVQGRAAVAAQGQGGTPMLISTLSQ
jgi:hypothetical protein